MPWTTTRTARALTAGALSVLLCGLAFGGAAAPGKSGRCPGKLLMADGRSKVVKRDGVYRACRNGRRFWMGADDGVAGDVLEIALAGRFVAWERAVCGKGSTCIGAILVRDLERGTRRSFSIPDGQRTADDLVVTRSGSVAWIRLGRAELPNNREVRAADATGERVLDQGDQIDPRSLAISGRRIYWMSGGAPRSELLSD